MRWLLSFLGSACLISFLSVPCVGQTTIEGSGKIINRERQVSNFRRVSIFGSGKLFITQDEAELLTIECDDNIVQHIQTDVKQNELQIRTKDVILKPSRPILYKLSLKQLDILKILNSASVEIIDLQTEQFKAVVEKSDSFRIRNINAQILIFQINGPGTVRVDSGTAVTQTISITGPAKFNASHLKSENVEIDIKGSGRAKIWVTKQLDAKISGSGKIEYYGSPAVSKVISVSGTLDPLGEEP